MTISVKSFGELSGAEVYEILKARYDVFAVERRICYPDMDNVDYEALHVFAKDDNGLVHAYLRLYRDAAEPSAVHMGRVLTRRHGIGLGRQVVEAGIRSARDIPGVRSIVLHSQQYCSGFYSKMGFDITSDIFEEAGIPHLRMELQL